jgi:hypothetical protein
LIHDLELVVLEPNNLFRDIMFIVSWFNELAVVKDKLFIS